MTRFVIILSDPLADFRSGDSDDGLLVGVVVSAPAESHHAKSLLSQLLDASVQLALDNEPQQPGVAPAASKQSPVEEARQLFAHLSVAWHESRRVVKTD
jgi:hypothetical protein